MKPTTFHPDADAEVTEAAEYYEISDVVISPVLADEPLVHSGVYPALRGTTHGLEAGNDIRTVQELLGHQDGRTTMISTHVLNRGGRGVRSPADVLSLSAETPVTSKVD